MKTRTITLFRHDGTSLELTVKASTVTKLKRLIQACHYAGSGQVHILNHLDQPIAQIDPFDFKPVMVIR